MSLALKFGFDGQYYTQGIIYFDAVLSYGRGFKGTLTSHSIGSGGKVSDHFIRDNPVYNINGIISAADISIGKTFITDDEGSYPDNVDPRDIPAVQIKNNGNSIISLLPSSISSFFVDAGSSVSVSGQERKETLNNIRTLLETFFAKDGITLMTLLEYKGNTLDKNRIIPNLVMTSLDFKEDANSGDALYIDVTLEQASFTEIETTTISKKEIKKLSAEKTAEELKASAAAKKNEGSKPPTTPPWSISQAADFGQVEKKVEDVISNIPDLVKANGNSIEVLNK